VVCKNQDYRKICGRFYKFVPCCQEIEKKWSSLFPSNISGEICIAEIFELAKVAVENKLVKFRSYGVCMYPTLKPKDILHIEPKTAEEIKVGDIAVFRRLNYLYVHRTIAKGKYGDLSYILTRPDTSKDGNDGPSFNENILGIVSTVERKGRIINLAKEKRAPAKRMFFNFYLKRYHFKKKLFEKIIYVILYIQQIKIYRKIAAFLFSALHKKIYISIRVPLNFKMSSRFHQDISQEDLKLLVSEATEEETLVGWSIIAYMESKFAGIISFIHKPKSCPFSGWWISESKIRIRYRGMGIEERLLKESDAIFNELKVKEVFISFYEKRRLNKIIFRNLGFKETSVHKDKFDCVDRNKIIAPIVMQRQIV
jgi:signal peptidase I